MKKSVLAFIAFCLAFLLSLGFIYSKANPVATQLPEAQELQWHGHIENEYGTYNGAMLGDLFLGQGDFSFLSGEIYTGEWSDSFMSGSGHMIFPEIGEYTGELERSKRNGTGIFQWYSGETYTGHWENDAMSGEGKYTFANGSVLEGTFEGNKPIAGKLTYQSSLSDNASDTEIIKLTYTFSDKAGHILFVTKGGLRYDGDASGLVSVGHASITYPSGNTYSGAISSGKRNGTGTYTWKNTSGTTIAFYEGGWKNDHMNGWGEYHYSDSEYPYLSGYFINDTPTGTLTYYKAAGNTFETTWKNGTCTNIKET